jgi:predicted CoA-binding protein
MTTATSDFLSQRRIAVAGVSRRPSTHGANSVYRRLRERGYTVFAVNPSAERVEGDRAYPDLRSIPGGVDAVVIATAAKRAESIVRECKELGISHVWMHAGPAESSASPEAVAYCRANDVSVIPGGCPLMFGPTADFGHRCLRWWLERTGAIEREAAR